MTTPCSTATNHNFNIVIKASLELINLPLLDILASHVKDVDLFKEINSCQTLLSGRNQLRTDQRRICFLSPPAKPDYKQFDVTLLYKLIRNLCPLLRPTQGWGNTPQTTDTKLGDDIERLRLFRNNYYAHAVSKTIPDTEFETLWKDLKSVIRRIQANCQTVCSVNYEQELIAIENSKFSHGYLEKCKLLLEAFLKLQTDERDEPEVVIKGKDEVMCGDLARFVAVLKPYSSCWSITWQKRRGKVIEIIDTSTEKYSGSTNRQLVIQSVCKEDEGEYRVLLSHKSNGNGYIRCGYTICLHVFGEVPYLNDLRVTTGDEGIIIHYEVSRQSPEVQSIEWKKDGQVLNTKAWKYTGGSINSSSLTIRLPTEEDKGKYSCIITNAVGSVSKDVMLDVPSVAIEVNPTVYFGSNATITAVVSSTPPPEQVIWQKSKDGNNFHCIDIRKPKYYGSNDIHSKPLLVFPKATFDDKLNYRLLVRNKIRESISETVHLNVTGSPPNITTSQETNIKCKRLKLIGNVSLYDDSPDILEVFWTKNGEKIDSRGSGGRLSEVTIDNPSLIIRDVNVDDAGNYQLTAVNAVGSTTSNVITLDVPGVSFENTENKEDGTQRFVVTIQSVPSPLFVQWSSKGQNEDVYTPINCNGEDYKGTINTIPHPVLVVKKSHLENYNYQIEVTNFFGCTVKQISDNQHYPTENITKENKVYKDRNAGIKFAKLSNYLAEYFPHQKLHNLKLMLLASEKVENLSALFSAKSASECFTILYEENLFTQKDVIFMQFLLKEMGCDELYSQCIKYALKNKALCYFENLPDDGYTNVQFHIQGDLNDYTKEGIEHIVEVVADILECKTQEIFVNGVKPSNSFFLVLSLKEVYTRKLTEVNKQDRLRLMKLDIDFIIVDLKTIVLQSLEVVNRGIDGTAFHLSTNVEKRRTIEKKREKKGEYNLTCGPPKKQHRVGRSFTVEKDQSKNKVHRDSTSEQDINSHFGSPLISHYIQSHIFSSKAKTCTNPDEKNILMNKEDPSFVPDTFALVSNQTKIQPDKLIQISEISEGLDSPLRNILGPSTRKTKRKTEPKRLVCHQSKFGHLDDIKKAHKDAIFTTQDESVRRKYFIQKSRQETERLATHEPKKPGLIRGCDLQDPSVIIPNTAFHHRGVRIMPSIACNSKGSIIDDDDDGDDDDDDDYLLSLVDLLSSDEDSDNVANRGIDGTAFHLSTNIEKRRNIEKKREKKGEYNLTCGPPKKQHRALSVQGRSLTVEKDQSKNKVNLESTCEQDINSHLGSPLISHYFQSHIFSSKAKTCTNPDEKDIIKNKEDPRFVPDTFALVSDQTKIQPDKLIQTSEISEGIYSPLHNILGPSTRKTRETTEPKRLVCHQSKFGHLNDIKRVHWNDMFTTQDESVRRKYFKQGSGQETERLEALELIRAGDLNDHFETLMSSIACNSKGSFIGDDDDDEYDGDDYERSSDDLFSADEDSDIDRVSRSASMNSI